MDLHEVYTGISSTLSVGSYWDNYTGCDTALHAFFAYNFSNFDTNLYSPTNLGYGINPPAQGLTLLNQPLSHFNNTYWPNGSGEVPWMIRFPGSYHEFYNYMTGSWRDGTRITYGGNGSGGNTVCDHVFPDDPNIAGGWSMYDANMDPMNYSYSIASSGPFTFNSGDTIPLEMAITWARDYDGDHLSAVSLLRERIKALRAFYHNDSIPCNNQLSLPEIPSIDHSLTIFPNPATDMLTVRYQVPDAGCRVPDSGCRIIIYDIFGRAVIQEQIRGNENEITLDISELPGGLYIAKVQSSTQQNTTTKFIKK